MYLTSRTSRPDFQTLIWPSCSHCLSAQALEEWYALEKVLAPLQKGAALFPAAAIRSDPGVALTAARFLGWELLETAFVASKLGVSA